MRLVVSGILGLILIALVAAIVGWHGNRSASDRKQEARPLQAIDPCAFLDNRIRATYGNLAGYREWTLEDYVNDSNAVAKVTVEDIGAGMFETIDGGPPTPPTARAVSPTPTPIGAWWDDVDLTEYMPEDRILRPMVLSATHVYSGNAVDGYVVAAWGGTSSACPEYEYQAPSHVMSTAQTGDVGVVFLWSPQVEWETDPPAWFTHVQDKASALDGNYEPMMAGNWYRYESGYASTLHPHRPIEIRSIEATLEALTQ